MRDPIERCRDYAGYVETSLKEVVESILELSLASCLADYTDLKLKLGTLSNSVNTLTYLVALAQAANPQGGPESLDRKKLPLPP